MYYQLLWKKMTIVIWITDRKPIVRFIANIIVIRMSLNHLNNLHESVNERTI